MRTLVAMSAALLVASIGVAASAADLKSGLQVGENGPPFNVKDCTGPKKGKSLCYR